LSYTRNTHFSCWLISHTLFITPAFDEQAIRSQKIQRAFRVLILTVLTKECIAHDEMFLVETASVLKRQSLEPFSGFSCFFFRIVLTVPEQMITEACKRIKEFCEKHFRSESIEKYLKSG